VMLKARGAYQEKKLRLLGNLYANVAVDPSVSPSSANHLVELAGQLTYRQLVFLAIAAEQQRVGAMSREKDLHAKDSDGERITRDGNAIALLTEMYDLYQRGTAESRDGVMDKADAWRSRKPAAERLGPAPVLPHGTGGHRPNGVGGVLRRVPDGGVTPDQSQGTREPRRSIVRDCPAFEDADPRCYPRRLRTLRTGCSVCLSAGASAPIAGNLCGVPDACFTSRTRTERLSNAETVLLGRVLVEASVRPTSPSPTEQRLPWSCTSSQATSPVRRRRRLRNILGDFDETFDG